MSKNNFPIPKLISISIRLAVSVGCASTVLPLTYSNNASANLISGWECISTIHNDWRCRPGAGQPYSLSLEEISKIRNEIKGSLTEKLSKKEKVKNKNSTEKLLALSDKEAPMRSLAEQDWVERLTNRSSWRQDQQFVPNSTKFEPISATATVTPEEAEGSVFLSSWLKRAKRRAAWPEQKDHENVSSLESTRQLHGLQTINPENKTVSLKKNSIPIKADKIISKTDISGEQINEPVLSIDKWLTPATEKSSLGKPLKKDSASLLASSRLSEKNTSIKPSRESVTSIIRKQTKSNSEKTSALFSQLLNNKQIKNKVSGNNFSKRNNSPLKEIKNNNTRRNSEKALAKNLYGTESTVKNNLKVEQIQPLNVPTQQSGKIIRSKTTSTAKPKPSGLRGMLLAHQANSLDVNENYPVNTSTRAVEQIITPAVNLRQKRTLPPLPSVEISPAEREARAPESFKTQYRSQQMPYSMEMAPEQWRYAPQGTLPPKSSQPLASAPKQNANPTRIHLPGNQSIQTRRSEKSSSEVINNNTQIVNQSAQSLTESELEALPPPIDRHFIADTQQRYRAENHLGPELPNFSQRISWVELQQRKQDKQNTRRNHSQNVTQDTGLKRPPPISPQEIFSKASEPNYKNEQFAPQQSKGQQKPAQEKRNGPLNSIDRLRQHAESADQFSQNSYNNNPWAPSNDRELMNSGDILPAPIFQQSSKDTLINSYRDGFSYYQNNNNDSTFKTVAFQDSSRAINSAISNKNNLKNLPDNVIAIQWAVSKQIKTLKALRQQFPALRKTQIIALQQNHIKWFALIGRIFSTPQAANNHLEQFSQPFIRKMNPWLRAIKHLKPLITDSEAPNTSTRSQHQALPQGSYTIEWFESTDIDQIKQLQTYFPFLMSAETRKVKRGNNVRYVLIQGRYANNLDAHDQLEKTLATMAITTLYPKVKPMGSLWGSHPVKVVTTQYNHDDSWSRTTQAKNTRQSSNFYTIQWLAANDRNILEQLKRRYHLLQNAFTQTVTQGHRKWYVLLQGQYSSKLAAKKALKSPEFKAIVTKLKPWLRPLDDFRTTTRL